MSMLVPVFELGLWASKSHGVVYMLQTLEGFVCLTSGVFHRGVCGTLRFSVGPCLIMRTRTRSNGCYTICRFLMGIHDR